MLIDTPIELSDYELIDMERRSEAATPGPWFSLVVGRDMEAGLNCIELGSATAMEVIGCTIADQDFIASARDDLPRLIAEVRRLKAAMDLRADVLSAMARRRTATVEMERIAVEHDG